MRLTNFQTVAASCLTLSMLASQGQVGVRAEPGKKKKPKNCKVSDFKLPEGLLAAFDQEELPPFITVEMFATFVTLKGGWAPGLATTETPIVARIAHLVDTMHWNCAAMYSSTWLDGLTREDPLIRSPVSKGKKIVFHESTTRLLCMVHSWAAVVNEWHPEAFPTLSGVLEQGFGFEDLTYGFNSEVDAAFDKETGEPDTDALEDIAAENCYNPKIMAAIVARQLTEYGRRDGYNMYGDLGRDGEPCTANCRRYTDSTGYAPLGSGSSSTPSDDDSSSKKKKKKKPIADKFRWKPMLEDDGRGYFTRQEHVTPHIGKTAKRAILSDKDFKSRSIKAPKYDYDQEALLVIERLAETAQDDMKKAMIEFYDNKIKVIFSVLNSVVSYGLTFEQLLNFVFGITSSEYDSILVSWKLKVRKDLVRPTTWIQEQMSNTEFQTYGGPFQGLKTIKGKEFESWVRVMPHSEYISGSACICQSIKDFTEEWMELTNGDLAGPNIFVSGGSIAVPIATDQTGREAPFLQGSSKTEPGLTPASNLTLVAETMTVFRDQCGESRLDGGMHFSKSVPDAYALCAGIGNQAAFYSMDLLGEGGWDDTASS